LREETKTFLKSLSKDSKDKSDFITKITELMDEKFHKLLTKREKKHPSKWFSKLNSRLMVDLLSYQLGAVLTLPIHKKFFKNKDNFTFFPGDISFIPKIKFNVLGFFHDGINRFLDSRGSDDESSKYRLLDDSVEHLGKAVCRMNFCGGVNFVFTSVALHDAIAKSESTKLAKRLKK